MAFIPERAVTTKVKHGDLVVLQWMDAPDTLGLVIEDYPTRKTKGDGPTENMRFYSADCRLPPFGSRGVSFTPGQVVEIRSTLSKMVSRDACLPGKGGSCACS